MDREDPGPGPGRAPSSTRLKNLASSGTSWIQWGFVALIAVLCVVLARLQFQWIGEVGRAESALLQAGIARQARVLALDFDTELDEACAALRPTREELASPSPSAACLERWRRWQARNPRPLFRRVAFAIPGRSGIDLLGLDEKAGACEPIDWPSEFAGLHEYLVRVRKGGRPVFNDPAGEILEFPVFGERPGRGPSGGEAGWLLLQLDLGHVRDSWLPDLVQGHFGIGGELPCTVAVTVAATGARIFTLGEASDMTSAPACSVRLHGRGRGGGLRAAAGRTDEDGPWVLQAWPRAEGIDAVVSRARRRNQTVALVLDALILATAGALVFQTGRARALAADQMRFVATVSHELRTPLTVILGAGHNLARGIAREPDQVERYARLILHHAEQLRDLVEQTLALSGARQIHAAATARQPVDLGAVLREAIANVEDETRAAHCEVRLQLPVPPPIVAGDPAALRRLFQNLVSNAAKHGGDGGWIGITARTVAEAGTTGAAVTVWDRGPGVPEPERERIFQPFYRGPAARTGQVRGSGLGLAVAREIAEAHHGWIRVGPAAAHDPAAATGAAFTVHLPVAT
jgi:signal transduction histidine kinase